MEGHAAEEEDEHETPFEVFEDWRLGRLVGVEGKSKRNRKGAKA